MNKIVSKFGGTSMGSPAAMKASADIVINQNPAIVVVSAISGVTNLLEEIIEGKSKSLARIKRLHADFCKKLSIPDTILDKLYSELKQTMDDIELLNETTPAHIDLIYSFGERLSSTIFHQVLIKHGLEIELVDARTLIKTDSSHTQANPNFPATKKSLKKLRSSQILTQGFVASDKNGATTTLGRGGSDFSAAILAEAIGADELYIWTDTDGIFSADPRVVPNAKPIKDLGYDEAAELAYAGAKIIYPPTLIPAQRSKIIVYIKNTFDPKSIGTRIWEVNSKNSCLHAVAVKKNQSVYTIQTPKMTEQYGYIAQIFNLLAAHAISVDQVVTSETAVSISIKERIKGHKDLVTDLKLLGELTIERNISMVTVSGNNITDTIGVGKLIIDAISGGDNPLLLRGVNQGASKHSFSVFVSDADADESARRLHDQVIMQS